MKQTLSFNPSLWLLFIGITLTNCGKEKEPINYDQPLYHAFNAIKPSSKILSDTHRDLLYLLDWGNNWDNKELIAYNYALNEISARTAADVSANWRLANYTDESVSEVFIAGAKELLILDGVTLEQKEPRHVLSLPGHAHHISSLSAPNPHTLIIGAHYGTSSLNADITVFFDRNSNQIIDETYWRDRLKRLIAYENTDGSIGVTQIGGNYPLHYDEFSASGQFTKHVEEINPQGDFDKNLLWTNAAANYFITGTLGSIYDKKSLAHEYTINKPCSDIILSEMADTLYVLTGSQLEIIEYSTKATIQEVTLEAEPFAGFKDGRQLILVYKEEHPDGFHNISLSKIDLW